MIFHLTILIQIWDDLGRDIQTVFCLDPWAWAMLQVASPWRLEAARPWQWWTASEGQFRWMAEDLAWFHKNLLSRAHRWDIYIYVYMDIQYAFTIHYYSFIIFSSCSLHFFAVFRVWSDCDILFDLSILHYLLSSTFCWLNEKTLWTNQPVGIRHPCCIVLEPRWKTSARANSDGEHQKIWKPSGILCQVHAVSLVPLHPATRYLDGPCS